MPTPDSGGEWGVLGGSFDPVHNGHLNLAHSIYESKKLDGILFVPSYHYPLASKMNVSPFEDRLSMLELALVEYPEFLVTQIEKLEKLSGYTIETLRALKKRFPKADFYFIIGADLLKNLDKWHNAEELLKEFKFLAGGRPGVDEIKMDVPFKDKVELIDIDELDISASDIRQRVKNDIEIKSMVPEKVADYIFENNLYK